MVLAGGAVLEGYGTFERWSLAEGSKSLGRRVVTFFPFPSHLLLPDCEWKVPGTSSSCTAVLTMIPLVSVNQNELILPLVASWQVFMHGNKKISIMA